MNDNAAAVATLARLRRGVGHAAHESVESWGLDGLEDLAQLRLEEAEARDGEVPTESVSRSHRHRGEADEKAAEEAVHLAVTLWALHQQSIRDTGMHQPEWPFGRSMRRLAAGKTGTPEAARPSGESQPLSDGGDEAKRTPSSGGRASDDELSDSLRKRFVRVGTANSFEVLATRLREVVLLLRAARIPIDYGRLADQLYWWQNERLRAQVRLAWGRDFHWFHAEDRPSEAGTKPSGDTDETSGGASRPGWTDQHDAEDIESGD
ncbi:type I-E CRISPR-associated protein Cse2/CasB [Streptomyces mobaraensis]|nr:type I-E CRISPR-associated protein Cse2/CasB [Streptomyces mobaraensis]UBI36006.1 type I-E CRISPR-associated protein Cse2/CasB [Streptomyces mobaraensis]